MSFFHRNPALHFELPESSDEFLSRFIFSLFKSRKVTDGEFWLDPEIIIMKGILHLLPCRDRIDWQVGILGKSLSEQEISKKPKLQ